MHGTGEALDVRARACGAVQGATVQVAWHDREEERQIHRSTRSLTEKRCPCHAVSVCAKVRAHIALQVNSRNGSG
jgi:hypothetical protein